MMRGIEPHETAVFRRQGYHGGINYMIKEYNLPLTYDDVKAQLLKILEYYYFNVAEAKPGVKEFLKLMYDNGVKMCIASATDKYLVEAALERNDLLKYFCGVFSTQHVGLSKREPYIFNLAKEHMKADSDVFVFEDALYAIETAKKAGYKVVAVSDYSAEDQREEIEALADYFINDYSEVYNIFNLRK